MNRRVLTFVAIVLGHAPAMSFAQRSPTPAQPPQHRPDSMPHPSRTTAIRFEVPLQVASSRTAAEDSIVTARGDTGRMLPGYRDFTRYTTPAMCWEATKHASQYAWRRGEHDTAAIALHPDRDTLPTAAVHVARACVARFSLSTVDPKYARHLQSLLVAAGENAKARAVEANMMRLATTANERKSVLLDAFDVYFDRVDFRKPVRLPEAHRIAAQLDSMGHEARFERAWVHAMLTDYYFRSFNAVALQTELTSLKALQHEFSSDDDDLRFGYAGSQSIQPWVYWIENPTARLESYSRGAQGELEFYRNIAKNNSRCKDFPKWYASKYAESCNASNLIKSIFELWYAPVGKPAPILQAKYWFNTGESAIRPLPGKVNFMVELYEYGWGRPNAPVYIAFLKRMAEKYAKDGLAITIVQSTHGYAWNSPVLTPEQEAKAYAWYYLDYWKMPVTLAVVETPFERDELGRRVDKTSPIKTQYPPLAHWLIGRDGKVLETMVGGNGGDGYEEAVLRKALGLPEENGQ